MTTTVAFVIGTHKETPIPKEVKKLGLLERFAIIQNTSRPDKTYMYFDSDIAMKVLGGLEQVWGIEAHIIYLGTSVTTQKLADTYNHTPEEERDVFERAAFYQDDKTVCLVVSEDWAAVGGPAVYHDSVTYSVYSATNRSEDYVTVLQQNGINPTIVHHTNSLSKADRLVSASIKEHHD
jgi:hypothetical protein